MACGTKGVYGRAKGTASSKAEPWDERCVKNTRLGGKDGAKKKNTNSH